MSVLATDEEVLTMRSWGWKAKNPNPFIYYHAKPKPKVMKFYSWKCVFMNWHQGTLAHGTISASTQRDAKHLVVKRIGLGPVEGYKVLKVNYKDIVITETLPKPETWN